MKHIILDFISFYVLFPPSRNKLTFEMEYNIRVRCKRMYGAVYLFLTHSYREICKKDIGKH